MSTDRFRERIGFLSIQEQAEEGFQGCLLVLDSLARPLEFHCTSPIKPTRAQAILYGPTLEPVLFGERIGLALLSRCEAPLDLVVTDSPKGQFTADQVETPFLRLPQTLEFGDSDLAGLLPLGYRDPAAAMRVLARLRRDFDFAEPFGRIQSALQEARRAA